MPNKRNTPRTCENCAAPFMAAAYEVKLGRGRYCSLHCANEHKRQPRIQLACEFCGDEFELPPHRVAADPSKFCSFACYNAARSAPPKSCAHCGQAFHVKPSQRDHQYCSRACYREARTRPLMERFWEKVDMSGDCWVWTGSCSPWGYGQIGVPPNQIARAHRVSWELHHGPIPHGLYVCHHCDNPRCVRPDHLFLGTPSDNTQDMLHKGRHWTPFRVNPG